MRSKLLLLLEAIGVLLIALGVSARSIPVALMVIGVAVVAACEIHAR